MEAMHGIIGAGIVGAFTLGLIVADRAYNGERKRYNRERDQRTAMIVRQAEAIDELQLDNNELHDSNRALQAQNWTLARERFAILNLSNHGQDAAA